jgi:hypothetical protein
MNAGSVELKVTLDAKCTASRGRLKISLNLKNKPVILTGFLSF